MVVLCELKSLLLLAFFWAQQLLFVESISRSFHLWVRIMKFSCLLIGMVLFALLRYDVLLKLLIGIVRISIERSALLKELENVDHCNCKANYYKMIKKVLKNVGSLSTMRILSRLLQFFLKTYLIRTQLDEEILAHLLHLDLIINTSLHIAKSCFKPSYQKV